MHKGIWGTICNTEWDRKDATVVCQEMGLQYSSIRSFGPGVGPIWLKGLDCTGNELSVRNCQQKESSRKCDHDLDAGVVCTLRKILFISTQIANYLTMHNYKSLQPV